MTTVKRLFNFLASYGLSIILLLLLMMLVFFGTLEQTRLGLYEAQRRYFESLIVVHPLFGRIPLPMPGGYLLLGLVFINMLCGAIIKAPKRFSQPGLLIAHGGVIFLIAAGFVAHHHALSGNIPLFEGETGDRFQSYYDWELRITETGEHSDGRQFIIPQEQLEVSRNGTGRVFFADALPFTLRVARYYANCRPVPGHGPWSVDGVALESLASSHTAEQNAPGLVAHIQTAANDSAPRMGLLWAMERAPWRVTVDGRDYALSLNRREWVLPFSLTLNRFNHETHPGTGIPSHFSSEITLTEGFAQREVVIRMNEPLRHRGYTFYQASWGPPDAPPGARLYSVLAVARNPAGQWPMYASCVISLGLLMHFCQVLFRYLKRQARAKENCHEN